MTSSNVIWVKTLLGLARARNFEMACNVVYAQIIWYLSIDNPIRRRAIDLIELKWFDRFILLTIAANCFQMAADDPREKDPTSSQKQLSATLEVVFWTIFAIEATSKIIALGFCQGKGTYWKDSWNRLDFVIVLTGLLEFTKIMGSSSVVLRDVPSDAAASCIAGYWTLQGPAYAC